MKKQDQRKACRRQHTIPQFLLKGFSSRILGDNIFAFLFRESCEVCQPNIENIGLANQFYDGPCGNTIDVMLTEKENRYASLIENLRQGHWVENNKPLVDEFVNHLIIRTRSLRVSASNSFEAYLEIMLDEFIRPENRSHLQRMIVEGARKQPEIRRLLNALPQAQRESVVRKQLKPVLESQNLLEMVLFVMQMARPQVNLADAARDGQLKALGQLNETLRKRADLLMDIQWSLRQYERHSLILGDLGPIAKAQTSAEWRQPLAVGEPDIVCLPISDQHLLFGCKGTGSVFIDPEELNCAAAELSAEFFVASCDTTKERGYFSKLGIRSRFAPAHEMREVVQQVLADM